MVRNDTEPRKRIHRPEHETKSSKKDAHIMKDKDMDKDMDQDNTLKSEESVLPDSRVFVLPGDIVGTAEEFILGKNTFKHGGNVYSTTIGEVNINKKNHVISVIPKVGIPPMIENGDVIIGRVSDLKSSIALVEIALIEGKGEREIVNNQQAAIHISNVKDSYVKDIYYEFSPFDIIKAKVIDTKLMRLSTSGGNMGVIKAFCKKCHVILDKPSGDKDKKGKLICPVCGNYESRKLSSEYSGSAA